MPSERRQRQASCMQFSIRVEHEIALGRADTGQARAGIGLEVGLFRRSSAETPLQEYF
jgi:hypothetical protein